MQSREARDRADFELVLEAYNRRGYSKGTRGIYPLSTLLLWLMPLCEHTLVLFQPLLRNK